VAVALALAVPGPVAGMALVMAYNAALPPDDASRLARIVFKARILVYDTPAIIVLACVLRTLPYTLLVLWPALRALPQDYLDAAAVEGYGPIRRVAKVALPLTAGAAVAAWFVSFVLGLGELPAVNLVSPPGATPLSVRVWSLLHTGVASDLAGVGLVMMATIAAAGSLAAALLVRLFDPRGKQAA
jgi:iron(III) transport system permease protein